MTNPLNGQMPQMASPMMSQAGMVITLADVYVEVRQLRQVELASLAQQVNELSAQKGQVDDHETRIRALERWKYALPLALLTAAGASAAAIAQSIHH